MGSNEWCASNLKSHRTFTAARYSQSSTQSMRSLTTEIRAEPAGRKPSALRALLPPVNTCFVLS